MVQRREYGFVFPAGADRNRCASDDLLPSGSALGIGAADSDGGAVRQPDQVNTSLERQPNGINAFHTYVQHVLYVL